MPRAQDLKLLLGFLVVLVVFGVNVLVSASNLTTVSHNRAWVLHTMEVSAELEGVLSSLKDAETGQRGYLLTGQENYLDPYKAALQSIPPRLAHLHDLTSDNLEQQQRVTALKQLTEGKLSELQETIVLRRAQREVAARQLVLSGRGKGIMDDIRTLITRMQSTEKALLAIREQESKRSEQRTQLTFVGATAVGIALLLALYLLVMRSFAERRQFTEAIQKREEWLSTTLASIGDAVIATDEKGDLLFMNGVAEALTGWTEAEAKGRGAKEVFSIVNETTRDPVPSPIEKAIRENLIVGLANHTVLIARDGREYFIDDSAAPIRNAQGDLLGVVLVFREINERRAKERQIEDLNQRLQRAMAESHHRIKNNLQALSSLLEMERIAGGGTVSVSSWERLAQHIRALATLHDLLTLESKVNPGGDAIPLNTAIERIQPALQHSAGGRLIQVKAERLFLPLKETGSFLLLFNELVSNAIKHGKGDVEVTLSLSDAREAGDAAYARLEVCDNGAGFPADFDPGKAANTGLELIQSLAGWDLHGQVVFENRPEGGGRVIVTFPIATYNAPQL